MSLESLIIAVKITLTLFFIYRLERFMKSQRSGELNVVLLFLTILLAIAIGRSESLDQIGKWLSAVLVAFFGLCVFEPELIELIDGLAQKIRGEKRLQNKEIIGEVVRAAQQLAAEKTGALIAFEQKDSLAKLAESGIAINADVKKDLLTTLFFKNTPTHDGCLLIRNGRITHCAVVLPLTTRIDVAEGLGTRHRAAIGLSEKTDAVCLVVSEEEGSISIAKDGKLRRYISPSALEKELKKLLIPTKEKRYYPVHYLKYFSVKEHSNTVLQFTKSFGQHLTDVLTTTFWLLTYVFWNPNGFPKSLDLAIEQPWVYLPFVLLVLNLISTLLHIELTLNAPANRGKRKWRILFVVFFSQSFALASVKQVALKREMYGHNLWTLQLDGPSLKPILIDRGSSFEALAKSAERIRELLHVEIESQSAR